MADSWTITAADSDTLTIDVTIDGSAYQWALGRSDVDLSNEFDLLTAVRDFVTSQRDAVRAAQTPPQIVGNLVGHSEEF